MNLGVRVSGWFRSYKSLPGNCYSELEFRCAGISGWHRFGRMPAEIIERTANVYFAMRKLSRGPCGDVKAHPPIQNFPTCSDNMVHLQFSQATAVMGANYDSIKGITWRCPVKFAPGMGEIECWCWYDDTGESWFDYGPREISSSTFSPLLDAVHSIMHRCARYYLRCRELVFWKTAGRGEGRSYAGRYRKD